MKAKEVEIRRMKSSTKDCVAKLASRKGRLRKIIEEIEEKQSRIRYGILHSTPSPFSSRFFFLCFPCFFLSSLTLPLLSDFPSEILSLRKRRLVRGESNNSLRVRKPPQKTSMPKLMKSIACKKNMASCPKNAEYSLSLSLSLSPSPSLFPSLSPSSSHTFYCCLFSEYLLWSGPSGTRSQAIFWYDCEPFLLQREDATSFWRSVRSNLPCDPSESSPLQKVTLSSRILFFLPLLHSYPFILFLLVDFNITKHLFLWIFFLSLQRVPIGPIGMHLTLKDEAWAVAVEHVIQDTLSYFIVDNYEVLVFSSLFWWCFIISFSCFLFFFSVSLFLTSSSKDEMTLKSLLPKARHRIFVQRFKDDFYPIVFSPKYIYIYIYIYPSLSFSSFSSPFLPFTISSIHIILLLYFQNPPSHCYVDATDRHSHGHECAHRPKKHWGNRPGWKPSGCMYFPYLSLFFAFLTYGFSLPFLTQGTELLKRDASLMVRTKEGIQMSMRNGTRSTTNPKSLNRLVCCSFPIATFFFRSPLFLNRLLFSSSRKTSLSRSTNSAETLASSKNGEWS